MKLKLIVITGILGLALQASSLVASSDRSIASLAERGLVQAISLINAKEDTQAYALLERVFPKAKQKMDKARVALLLALSPSTIRLKRFRHTYAKFAEANHLALDEEMRRRLQRIRGDSYFTRGKIHQAKRAYQQLLGSSQISRKESEYATYQLGWVYINEKQPDRAFRLWQNWLMRYQDGELKNALVRDLGQAWTESLARGKRIQLRWKFTNTSLRSSFLDGVLKYQYSKNAIRSRNILPQLGKLGLKDRYLKLAASRKSKRKETKRRSRDSIRGETI